GAQGLLIPRAAYDKAGGHRTMPLMEDLDLVRRIGMRRLKMLRARAISNAARYRREGYLRAALSNQTQRILYCLHRTPAAPLPGGKP
ncbi:MAG: glycosyl transferase family 2, partial [Hyphomicrobium sp.]|nr:glycosyl transferase family 2 [Hyphomicrobium sp.]